MVRDMPKVSVKKGGEKSPRKHDPRWKDTTRAERQQKRLAALNAAARAAGWASWSAYETAVVNGVTQPTSFAADTRHALEGGRVSDNQGAG